MSDDVEYITAHSSRPLLAVSCRNGFLQIWDYSMKLLMNLREFSLPNGPLPVGQMRPKTAEGHKYENHLIDLYCNLILYVRSSSRPLCLQFDPRDEFIAIGFSNGLLKFVFVDSLADISFYNIGNDAIIDLKFCPSGEYLAAYDHGGYLMIFKR